MEIFDFVFKIAEQNESFGAQVVNYDKVFIMTEYCKFTSSE